MLPLSGVMAPPIDQTTADGFDLQFGTNVIGHHLFSVLLHPALRAGARTAPAALGGARVVHLSSVAAYAHASLDFASFVDGPARRRKGSSVLYLQSKFVCSSRVSRYALVC
jgi:retinol dehydrogenase-12